MTEDVASTKDMRWLVDNRSKNQQITMLLYECYKDFAPHMLIDSRLRVTAQRLTMATFSLWRAVFLSNTANKKEVQIEDAMRFLENLILHNMVTYQNDQKAKNFTFSYYVSNANDRLKQVAADKTLNLLPDGLKIPGTMSAFDWWEANHRHLVQAVENFKTHLEGLGPPAPKA